MTDALVIVVVERIFYGIVIQIDGIDYFWLLVFYILVGRIGSQIIIACYLIMIDLPREKKKKKR